MPWTPNVFAEVVLDNYQFLRQNSQSGVGRVIPQRELIGRCLQNFVDDQVRQQNAQGDIRVNTLSDAHSIFSVYV